MRTLPIRAAGSTSPPMVERAAEQVRALLTLADVFDWARRSTPPRPVLEIVTQDEYTHDVLLPFEPGHFLVFDAT